MKTSIGVIFFVILVGVILLWGGDIFSPQTPDPSPSSSPSSVEEGFEVYHNEELGITVWSPLGASIQPERENIVKMTFLGPDNEPYTEITDGFTVTFRKDLNAQEYTSLDMYAQSVLEADMLEGEESLQETTIGLSYEAFMYTRPSELGNLVTTYITLPQEGVGYQISYSITDPHQRGYQEIVTTILNSLQFTS